MQLLFPFLSLSLSLQISHRLSEEEIEAKSAEMRAALMKDGLGDSGSGNRYVEAGRSHCQGVCVCVCVCVYAL